MRRLVWSLALLVVLVCAPPALASSALVGDSNVEGTADSNTPGRAQAWPYTVLATGTSTQIDVYIDLPNTASKANIGLYSDHNGHPGSLLASGSATALKNGAWNQITVNSVSVTSGTKYWLALLGTGGTIAFRDKAASTCHSEGSSQTSLSSLPSTWSTGPVWGSCPASVYLNGNTTTGTAAYQPPSPPTGCFANPSACGYPDVASAGVPAGTLLSPYNGDMTVRSAGQVVSGLDINGSIRIMADNVTIKDVRVTSSGANGHNILIAAGVSGVTIEDSTLRGVDPTSNPIQYAVQNSGDSSVRGLRLSMYNCTQCWAGAGTVQDSYVLANGVVNGTHYESLFYGGGGGPLVVDHDTLLNPHGFTADVFTQPAFGDLGTVTITNSLVAGGGYMIYGGGTASNVRGPLTVAGNRFARCLTASIGDGAGYYCAGGADSHGYWPRGGYYGVDAYVNRSITTWQGNFWDDNLRAVPEE